MISQFGANMQQMQTQMYSDFQQENYRSGENWIATFGNEINMQDPSTGSIYIIPDGYSNYCLTASGQNINAGPDLQPGQWIDNPSNACQTVLRPW